MIALYTVTAFLVVVSLLFDRDKTFKGIKVGIKKFTKILPKYLLLLTLIAIVLFFSEQFIASYLGQENNILGIATGLALGSITMMPGFVAYPLAGVLISKGVLYSVVASFVTTLMMVGVVTFPVEREYMGIRATIMRNGMSLLVAIVISLAVGVFYGEFV